MARARTTFEIDKVNRMLEKVEAMATARKNYETAVATATQTALTNLAPKVETYRNAIASAWGTAVTTMYNNLDTMVTDWATKTNSGWGNYVLSLVNNAKTEADALVAAYKLNVADNAAAEKTAAIAQANAAHSAATSLANLREDAAKSAAQRNAKLQRDKWTAQRGYEVELANERLKTAKEEINLWRGMTESQLATTLGFRSPLLSLNHACNAAMTALSPYNSYAD